MRFGVLWKAGWASARFQLGCPRLLRSQGRGRPLTTAIAAARSREPMSMLSDWRDLMNNDNLSSCFSRPDGTLIVAIPFRLPVSSLHRNQAHLSCAFLDFAGFLNDPRICQGRCYPNQAVWAAGRNPHLLHRSLPEVLRAAVPMGPRSRCNNFPDLTAMICSALREQDAIRMHDQQDALRRASLE